MQKMVFSSSQVGPSLSTIQNSESFQLLLGPTTQKTLNLSKQQKCFQHNKKYFEAMIDENLFVAQQKRETLAPPTNRGRDTHVWRGPCRRRAQCRPLAPNSAPAAPPSDSHPPLPANRQNIFWVHTGCVTRCVETQCSPTGKQS